LISDFLQEIVAELLSFNCFSLPRQLGLAPAGDGQHATGDKACGRRDEPSGGFRDLLGRADAAQWGHPLNAIAEGGLRELVARHVGRGEAGGDRIDPDAVGPDLGCEALGEAFDRAFGRRIAREPWQSAKSRGDRRNIDDRPPAPAVLGREPKHGLFAGEDGSNHIDLKELRQLRSLPLVGRGEAPGAACVAYEAGERPQRLGRLVEQPRKLSCVRDIRPGKPAPPDLLISATVASAALASAA
jgi:hypothetical protein